MDFTDPFAPVTSVLDPFAAIEGKMVSFLYQFSAADSLRDKGETVLLEGLKHVRDPLISVRDRQGHCFSRRRIMQIPFKTVVSKCDLSSFSQCGALNSCFSMTNTEDVLTGALNIRRRGLVGIRFRNEMFQSSPYSGKYVLHPQTPRLEVRHRSTINRVYRVPRTRGRGTTRSSRFRSFITTPPSAP